MSGQPFSKAQQTERGPKRTARIKATPYEWAGIVNAKGQTCRLRSWWAAGHLARRRTEYHHLVSRKQLGDDVVDNIVPLCTDCHARVTQREPHTLAALAASLTDTETAYVQAKLGSGGMERLFGVRS